MEDVSLPNQNGFYLLWVEDGLLAFEKRHFSTASLALIYIEGWLRMMIAEFFSFSDFPIFPTTNLWVWKEGEGWRLLDRLTGVVRECLSSVIPCWAMCGDLDGDGKEEIFFWESRSWWIGQWKDGRWRKSRPIEGYTDPVDIIRDGKQRWLLCFDCPNRFIAVRIAE
ncbi:MAG: hypothetical protein ACUVRR_13375 [Candidatus Fervidibacter sp.]|uniref:hypothetical protein n=1 Tax=Candidatus Fervidibacter sp. TaxID=3100871 RepID=UPI00404A2EF0